MKKWFALALACVLLVINVSALAVKHLDMDESNVDYDGEWMHFRVNNAGFAVYMPAYTVQSSDEDGTVFVVDGANFGFLARNIPHDSSMCTVKQVYRQCVSECGEDNVEQININGRAMVKYYIPLPDGTYGIGLAFPDLARRDAEGYCVLLCFADEWTNDTLNLLEKIWSTVVVVCASCHGEGVCATCNGNGACNVCGGTGAGFKGTDCFVCDGTGKCISCHGAGECHYCGGQGYDFD